MACSGWLFVLVVILMTSLTNEQQTTCSHSNGGQPEVPMEKEGARPWPGCNNSLVPPPGVGFLGRGFDVYYGNLLSAGGDTGFRLPVVHLSYRDGRRAPDHRHLLPDHTDLLYVTTPRQYDVMEVRSRIDLLRMINKRIQVQPAYLQDGRFMASGDYRDFRSGQDTELHNVEEHPMYSLSFDSPRLKASESFRNDVGQLPASCGPEDIPQYLQLLQKYGTHVVTHVTLGRMTTRHVTLTTEYVMLEKLRGHSLNDIFTQALNDSSMSAQLDQSNIVPLRVQLEQLDHFFSTSITGHSSIGLVPKRQCLTQAISDYCSKVTSSTCQTYRNTSQAIRYGDSVTLTVGSDAHVFIEDDVFVIGSDTVSRLTRGKQGSIASSRTTLQVLPPRGLEERLGQPVYADDIFTLGVNQDAGSRVKVDWANRTPYSASVTSAIYFHNARKSSYQTDSWQLYTEESKGHPYRLDMTTSTQGSTVTAAGPWSLTVETASSMVSLVIDPCRKLCHPGGVVMATVVLPPGAGNLNKIRLSALPAVLGVPTREGNWTVQEIKVTDLVTMATYTTHGSATLTSPCGPCVTGQWDTALETLKYSQPTLPNSTSSLDAQFYFRPVTRQEDLVLNSSMVELHLVAYTPNFNSMESGARLSCNDKPCTNGGSCSTRGQGAVCQCSSMWSGPTCNIPCFAELFSASSGNLSSRRGVYGSSGQPSTTDLQWVFSPGPSGTFQGALPFVLLLLPVVSKVSALSAPLSQGLRQIDIEYFDVDVQAWRGNVTTRVANNLDRTYIISVHGSGSLITDKLRFIYRGGGAALDLEGVVVYGCSVPSTAPPGDYVAEIVSNPLKVTKRGSYPIPPVFDGIHRFSTNVQPLLVTEELKFQVPIATSLSCNLDRTNVLWSISQQIDLCPSNLEVNNFTLTTDTNGHRVVFITLTLRGEEPIITRAKQKLTRLVDFGNLTLICEGQNVIGYDDQVRDAGGDVTDRVSSMEFRMTVLSAVVIVLVILCLVVFIVFLVVMSRRYRDIRNELTTLRKLEMQKRLAKRQELQPQVPPHPYSTLPRPSSTTGSSTTTSIPGRSNGQTRPLRYSQSLHGLGDRPRLSTAVNATGRAPGGPLDPAQYVIASPLRTPSPVGTRSGEESDTVQSVC